MIRVNRIAVIVVSLLAGLLVAGCGGYDNPSPEAKPASQTSAAETPAVPPAAVVQPAETSDEPAPAATPDFADRAATPDFSDRAGRRLPTELQADPNAVKTPRTIESANASTTQPAASTLTVTPTPLDLGSIATGKYANGTVTLKNTGTEPIIISQCKTSCGCTSTNCPKGEQIGPGDSTDVEIKVTAGSRARTIKKTVTFLVEGQRPVSLPVSVNVVAYVTVDPQTIDPEKVPDGRMTIRSTDNQPFRIVSMSPRLVEGFEETEEDIEHVVYLSWDRWKELGQNRRLVFNLDHPEIDQVSALVRYRAPSATARPADNPLADARQRLSDEGVIDAPLTDPEPAQKLKVAVKYGDLESINAALASGLDQAQRDTLLTLASRYGQPEVIAALLETGASLEAKDKFGRTPLISSIQSRNPAVISLLLARGANVQARDSKQGTALLHSAGAFGNVQIMQSLLAAGADVNATDGNGQSALMWAARWGDSARVDMLVKAGADATLRDKQGLTALDYARNRTGQGAAEMVAIIQPLVEGKGDSGGSAEPGVD